jgi:hypothetical protein
MRWKGKLLLFFVNKVGAAGGIFYSLHRMPIPFSFRLIGLISATDNIQPAQESPPSLYRIRPARSDQSPT